MHTFFAWSQRALRRPRTTDLVAYAVTVSGLLVIAATLQSEKRIRGNLHIEFGVIAANASFSLLAGLGLLYLGFYLKRRKRTVWTIAVGAYTLLLLANTLHLIFVASTSRHFYYFAAEHIVIDLCVPAVILWALLHYRKQYTVKSDVRNFALSLRLILVVGVVALAYGVGGFLVMDDADFHEEIALPQAIHYTVDQFNLTTTHRLVAHTRTGRAFIDSLSVISFGAVGFAALSLAQPIRMRFTEQAQNRQKAKALLTKYPASSEDFFKLWPHDKLYFFNQKQTAGLAYHVYSGVALVVGDPFGDPAAFDALLRDFDELCFTNDWSPAFIHTEPKFNEFYKERGFSLQKIGEEAVLDLAAYRRDIASNKYFRHIRNKFTKQNYATELLMPPHSEAVLRRLEYISQEWLSLPGREERGFMMGYFSRQYMHECPIMVLKDAAGAIQAFINQIPSYDPGEANFDLLRHTKDSPGNSNDYLLMQFIEHLHEQGLAHLNLGLCPLAGLAARDEERSLVDSALSFVYANGDRFYSFSGLHRFKAKYEPEWSSRYIAYRGGFTTFTRILNALNRAMRV